MAAYYNGGNSGPGVSQGVGDVNLFREAEKKYQLHWEQRMRTRNGRLVGGKLAELPTDLSGLIDVHCDRGAGAQPWLQAGVLQQQWVKLDLTRLMPGEGKLPRGEERSASQDSVRAVQKGDAAQQGFGDGITTGQGGAVNQGTAGADTGPAAVGAGGQCGAGAGIGLAAGSAAPVTAGSSRPTAVVAEHTVQQDAHAIAGGRAGFDSTVPAVSPPPTGPERTPPPSSHQCTQPVAAADKAGLALCYSLPAHPGFFLLPGALPASLQLRLMRDSLALYPEPPANTNHTLRYGQLPGLWQAAQARPELSLAFKLGLDGPAGAAAGSTQQLQRGSPSGPAPFQPSITATANADGELMQSGQRPPSPPASSADTPSALSTDSPGAAPAPCTGPSPWVVRGPGPSARHMLRKLRWATLGPQFNWTERRYDTGQQYRPLPAELCAVATLTAAAVQTLWTPAAQHKHADDHTSSAHPGNQLPCLSNQADQPIHQAGSVPCGALNEVSAVIPSSCDGRAGQGRSSHDGAAAVSHACCSSCPAPSHDTAHAPGVRQRHGEQPLSCGGERCGNSSDAGAAALCSPAATTAADGTLQHTHHLEVAADDISRQAVTANGAAQRVYRPDAAIVNYYHAGDTLGGHLDDVEPDMDAPIVGLSLGCDAVLLMGGERRDVAPSAVRLRSGDVVMLAGHARRCYHGVPRIFAGDALPPGLLAAAAGRSELQAVMEHMQQSRISISIRAVAPP